MKIAILGAKGQLGQHLQENILRKDANDFLLLDQSSFDLTQDLSPQAKSIIDFKPNFIINCAAYTQVDRAESETQKAMLINGHSLKELSELANTLNSRLIHISTDFVFDGTSNRPYIETDHCNPLSVYGKSKLLGETLIQEYCSSYTIFRTSWLYSYNHPSFLKTMLKLASERTELKVVNDQVGTPTSAQSLAKMLADYLKLAADEQNELYHFSNHGVASWYDFAQAIFKTFNVKVKLTPIPTSEYPTPAKRPSYSVLDKTKVSKLNVEIPDWLDELEKVALQGS